jgi:hypothetical protein
MKTAKTIWTPPMPMYPNGPGRCDYEARGGAGVVIDVRDSADIAKAAFIAGAHSCAARHD